MRLPLNCTLDYWQDFLSPKEADDLFQEFVSAHQIADSFINHTINGENFRSDFGKITVVDQTLYEKDAFPKAIYGKTMIWPASLQLIKERIEKKTQRAFQFCVCIYYPDGNAGVAFHSDPPAYGDTTVIPSLSLGEERHFQLREIKTGVIHEMILNKGSLLVMGEHCQERYEHCLPVDPSYKKARINLTFRQFGFKKNTPG
ncbi:MAG: alpha-ketoglutarate-dependent dioxygenase AlkB [Saprospiraceae bacterium]|nr:alpha-ketoglutarate-dependent dioxygenase AlkB [Saprospiraceae bacterium]